MATAVMTWCRMCGGGGDVQNGDDFETCPICAGAGEHPADLAYGAVGGDQPPVHYDGQDDVAACRVCGCTEDAACAGGCWWVPDPTMAGDLCSTCAARARRPAGDTTSGRMWHCGLCGAEVPSWELQDHLIGHS